MPIPIQHRVHVALDCECGATVEACEAGLRRDPADIVVEVFETIALSDRSP